MRHSAQPRPGFLPALLLTVLLGSEAALGAEERVIAPGEPSSNVPEAPRFGFKPVEDVPLRESREAFRDTDTRPESTRDYSAAPKTPNDVPHYERRGSATERLPDLQTYGRNPQIRRYGTLSGSDGIPRGVRTTGVRPQTRPSRSPR